MPAFVPELSVILAFALAAVVLAITPGPDMALQLSRAINYGRLHGLACAAGAMSGINTASRLVISVPNYASLLPAHNADIESLAGALDGVRRGRAALGTAQQPVLQGVAIFTERLLTESEWATYQEKWAAP